MAGLQRYEQMICLYGLFESIAVIRFSLGLVAYSIVGDDEETTNDFLF